MNDNVVQLHKPVSRTIADTARGLAVAHHETQKYGNVPYTQHLTSVAGLVALHTVDQETIAAAWLHDIVEDTEFTVDDIVTAYGPRVGHLVALLTDPNDVSRERAKAFSLPRIAASYEASLIKLADRYCNHQMTILTSNARKARLYLSEFDHFMHTFWLEGRDSIPIWNLIRDQRDPLDRLVRMSPA